MLILAVISFVAILLLALLTFPWRLAAVAVRNVRRADGSLSGKRLRIEMRGAVSFMTEVLLAPVLATTMLVGGVFVIDRYVIPLPLLRDVVSLFDAKFDVWDERMESGRFGDVGLSYGEWARSRGYSANTSYSLRKFLKNNWLALAVVVVAGAVFIYWFVVQYYLSALLQYRNKVAGRRERYRASDAVANWGEARK